MAKKPESSRIPSAVGAIPVVGDLMKSAETQAQWMQAVLEQNARLIGQFPATLKTFNDTLERFNQTVGRLDRAVTRIESASRTITGPLDKVAGALDPAALRELPETLDALRRESLPALRAATDTQRQIVALQTTVERVIGLVADLPGAGIVRRMTTGRDHAEDAGGGDDVPEQPGRERSRRAAPKPDVRPTSARPTSVRPSSTRAGTSSGPAATAAGPPASDKPARASRSRRTEH